MKKLVVFQAKKFSDMARLSKEFTTSTGIGLRQVYEVLPTKVCDYCTFVHRREVYYTNIWHNHDESNERALEKKKKKNSEFIRHVRAQINK